MQTRVIRVSQSKLQDAIALYQSNGWNVVSSIFVGDASKNFEANPYARTNTAYFSSFYEITFQAADDAIDPEFGFSLEDDKEEENITNTKKDFKNALKLMLYGIILLVLGVLAIVLAIVLYNDNKVEFMWLLPVGFFLIVFEVVFIARTIIYFSKMQKVIAYYNNK